MTARMAALVVGIVGALVLAIGGNGDEGGDEPADPDPAEGDGSQEDVADELRAELAELRESLAGYEEDRGRQLERIADRMDELEDTADGRALDMVAEVRSDLRELKSKVEDESKEPGPADGPEDPDPRE